MKKLLTTLTLALTLTTTFAQYPGTVKRYVKLNSIKATATDMAKVNSLLKSGYKKQDAVRLSDGKIKLTFVKYK